MKGLTDIRSVLAYKYVGRLAQSRIIAYSRIKQRANNVFMNFTKTSR